MNITLVNTDFPSAKAVPPLGVLSLAQAVASAGHSVRLRDYQLARPLDSREPRSLATFCDTEDEVLGVSVSGFSLPLVIAGIKELKREKPALTTVLGGIGASGAGTQIIETFPWIDIVVYGEGEKTLCELLDCLGDGREPMDVPGVIYRHRGQVYTNTGRARITDLESLGRMDYHFIELTRYQLINVISSRGCPFPCTFCDVAPYWQRKYCARPIELLVDEITTISHLVRPAPIFIFVDDTLTVDQGRMVESLSPAWRNGFKCAVGVLRPSFRFERGYARSDGRIWMPKVYLGLESGSDRVLQAIRKGFDAETGRKAALLASKFIPIVQTSFVWGFPFETWEDFYETLMMMAYLADKGVSVKANLLTPLPYSKLFEEYANTLHFYPEYSPQLHLAEYELDSEPVEMIRKYPRIFPCFYLYDNSTVKAKYDLLRKMKLSPEHIWDLWLTAKGTLPLRKGS